MFINLSVGIDVVANRRAPVNSIVGWLLLVRIIVRQRKITENAILSATLLALVAGFTFSTARSQRPTGPLPDQLQKTVDTKQITIKQALDALNVGTSDGVVPEMKFYALAPKIYMLVEILRQVNIRRARM